MKRRTVIKNSAYMLGGILSASTIATLLDSCVAPTDPNAWIPEFMSVEQGKVISKIADILIPTTDTPGALDALVPQFIDRVAKVTFTNQERDIFQKGWEYFQKECKKDHGKDFLDCSAEDQLTFLQRLEKEFVSVKGATWFGEIKRLTYQGFFRSEEGATEVLKYDVLPGNYDGCIPFSEVNGSWAT